MKEQKWLPQLADRLPLRVPTPVRLGQPGEGYPWHWSVVPWLEGAPADICAADSEQGATLAAFLHALHVPAPEDVIRSANAGPRESRHVAAGRLTLRRLVDGP